MASAFCWLKCTFFPCTAVGDEAVFDAQADCYSMDNATAVISGIDNRSDGTLDAQSALDAEQWEPKIILYRHTVVLDRLAAGRIEYEYVFESEKAYGHTGE